MLFIFLILAIIAIFVITKILQYRRTNRELIQRFKNGNVIVFGRKGCGKDLIFNYVIHQRNKHKEPYMSNIDYGLNGNVEPLTTLELGNNTYENFINNEVIKQEYKPEREKVDYYISDSGIFLPSQYNTLLDKKYKSLPIYYALSRHLYDSNVHANTQALSRIWIKLREQADSYIHAVRTYKILGLLITKYTIYDKYTTAEQEIKPININIFSNKLKKTKAEEMTAINGTISQSFIIQRKRGISYDTRHFKKVVFGEEC